MSLNSQPGDGDLGPTSTEQVRHSHSVLLDRGRLYVASFSLPFFFFVTRRRSKGNDPPLLRILGEMKTCFLHFICKEKHLRIKYTWKHPQCWGEEAVIADSRQTSEEGGECLCLLSTLSFLSILYSFFFSPLFLSFFTSILF